MRVLAFYYVAPDGERQKLVIKNPSKVEEEHYLLVADLVKAKPEGSSVGVFGASLVLPVRSLRRDFLLARAGLRTIRIEELDDQLRLGEVA